MAHIVQFAKAASGAVTLGSTPVNGNYLFAMVADTGGNTVASGWTAINPDTDNSGANLRVHAYYKQAGAGESTSQSPLNGAGGGCVGMWELQDVNTFPANLKTKGRSDTTANWAGLDRTVGAAAQDSQGLVIVCSRWNGGGTSAVPSITSTITGDGTTNGGDARYAAAFGHTDVSNGNSYTVTATFDVNSTYEAFFELLVPITNNVVDALNQATLTYTSNQLTEIVASSDALNTATLTYTGNQVISVTFGPPEALNQATLTYAANQLTSRIGYPEPLNTATYNFIGQAFNINFDYSDPRFRRHAKVVYPPAREEDPVLYSARDVPSKLVK